jgi:transposase-like protein
MSYKLQPMRRFSIDFKKEKVSLIISKKLTVKDISDTYNVSLNAVYRWLHKYGSVEKSERMVIEKISESAKTAELLKYIEKLESEVGRLHLENIFQSKIIDCGSEILGEDLKKKFCSRQ